MSASLALILMAVAVIKVRTAEGILLVEVNEPKAEVFVDGKKMIVSWHSSGKKAKITVPTGTHNVRVQKDGFSVDSKELTFKDGDRVVFRARLKLVNEPRVSLPRPTPRLPASAPDPKTAEPTPGAPGKDGMTERLTLGLNPYLPLLVGGEGRVTERLRLGPSATAAQIKALASLKILELHLIQSPVTEAVGKELLGLNDLSVLHLIQSPVTDLSAFKELARLKNLRELRLIQSAVTEEGLDLLSKELPECKILREQNPLLPGGVGTGADDGKSTTTIHNETNLKPKIAPEKDSAPKKDPEDKKPIKASPPAGTGVMAAIDKGVAALRKMQQADGTWPHQHIGATALAGLTLLECGADKEDKDVLSAADAVRRASIDLTYTYSISLSILFLDRLDDAGDVPLIKSLMERLLAG